VEELYGGKIMIIKKQSISMTIFILFIFIVLSGCSISENIDTKSARELKKEIFQISSSVKNVEIYFLRPSLWFNISFSEELAMETFDEVFLKIKNFTTEANAVEINKNLKSGSVSRAWANFDINNDGYDEYRFEGYGDSEWHSFRIPIGNSSSNLINGDGMVAVDKYDASAIAVENEDYIYYINLKDEKKLYRMKATGNGKEKVIDESVSRISIIGDYIYYIDKYGSICKFNKVKKQNSIIQKEKCVEYVVSGYWIYYIKDKTTGIYKVRTDGKHNELVINEYGYDLSSLNNDYLSYITKSSKTKTENSISIIDINTKEKTILDYNASRLVCENQGSLYYLDGSNNNQLNVLYYDPYRPNEGTKNLKLTSDTVGSFNWIDGGICYENLSDSKNLYMVSWEGNERIKLNSEQSSKISRIYNFLYYINDNNELVQYNEDTKEKKIIY
jgi:hypothetical protein